MSINAGINVSGIATITQRKSSSPQSVMSEIKILQEFARKRNRWKTERERKRGGISNFSPI